jgi:hypothetical protein
MKRTLATLLLLTALLAGCVTAPTVNHIPRLLAHPEFPAVREAAPEWARDALETINDLQRENEKMRIGR